MSDIEDEPPPVLLPCTVCSRTFRPEVLERHVKVCEKSAAKKRRVFDSFKNRVSGTELEEFLGPAPLPGQVVKRPSKSPVKKRGPPKWKETHENLIAVLRAARGVNPPPDAVVEAPKPAGNEQCPSCFRFFGPRAFDRHVEFCKEKTARIKMTPSKVSQAQERLEARTKYRAPLSIKPKLTTKEKYSPMLTRKESSETCATPSSTTATTTTKTSPPVPTLTRSSARQNGKQSSSSSFSRGSPGRSSERLRSMSPTKRNLVSSSKSKNEGQGKSSNQPRIKENLKDPDDLRPKTGSKFTTQEKIRSCNVKLTQLEDEIPVHTRGKDSRKGRERVSGKWSLASDSESVGTVEGESVEKNSGTQVKGVKSKWSSSESVSKAVAKPIRSGKAERLSDEEKGGASGTADSEKGKAKRKGESRSGKKKIQINDLSVNDETFGIFVASCQRVPATGSRTCLKVTSEGTRSSETKKETRLRKLEETEVKGSHTSEVRKKSGSRKSEPKPIVKEKKKKEEEEEEVVVVLTQDDTKVVNDGNNDQEKVTKPKRVEKASRIPKVKHESKSTNKMEKVVEMELEEEDTVTKEEGIREEERDEVEESTQIQDRSCEIKKKSKKWRNISEISTEDLASMSEDFNVPPGEDVTGKLSESEIWEIAAEQFLKSEETVQSSSLISVDSLEENAGVPKFATKKSRQVGDDFIVLHVTDPSKMVENDADMKLSMSEPCFAYSGKIQKLKENGGGGKKIDIIVFTAFPGELQRKLAHRKRKKVRRSAKRMPVPQSSPIREKTFLTDDLPKAKRMRFAEPEEEKKSNRLNLEDLKEYFFEASPKKEFAEKKRKFIEDLKKQREKIRKWQLTADTHMRFMEQFEKSIDDDLKELKDLFNGKKTKRRSGVREFIKEKVAKKRMEKSVGKETTKESAKSKNKKFEYFEINLEEVKTNDEKENRCPSSERKFENEINSARGEFHRENKPPSRKKGEGGTPKSRSRENKKTIPETDKETRGSDTDKKFECFEISNDFSKTTKCVKSTNKKDAGQVLGEGHEAEVRGRTSVEGSVKASPRNRFTTKETNSDADKSCARKSERRKQEVVERKDVTKYERRSKTTVEGKNWEVTTGGDSSMTDSVTCQNSSLENIEEVDENEEQEDVEIVERREERKDIEVEDFIISKPDTAKLLSREGNCLDELFPKPREIVGTVTQTDSTTAVRLGYTTDSVYDLKSKEEKVNKVLARSGNGKNPPSKILEKRRCKKGGNSLQLPQILVTSSEKKEHSMMSLIELWKTKKEGGGENEKSYKTKATLPSGKLTPLSNKNSFQIAVLPTILKRQLSEMVYVRPFDKGDGNESYDPFKQAERQMLALLSWPSTVDVKSAKDLSPKPKPSSPPHKTNLETSPTSAFTKYPNKGDKSPRNGKTATGTVPSRRNINETFEVNAETTKKNVKNEKPTYTAADDWEEIFEKHFDLNRNEMTEEMTRSMKSALDGLLKNSMKSNSSTGSSDKTDASSPRKSKSELENSVITEVLYTSTPKQNSKSESRTRTRSKDSSGINNNSSSAGLDATPNTYRKNSDLSYGRITPPDDFTDSYGKGGRREDKPNRNSGISLSSLSFCSQISDTTLADEEVMRSNLEIIGKAAAAAASRTPRRKYARSQSVFDERNKMLFAKTYDPNSSSSDENDVDTLPKLVADKQQGKKSPSRNPHPKPVPSSHFYRSQSAVEDRCKGDGDHSDDGDHISSPDANRNRKAKMSGDSAYSSLNRRSPRGKAQANQQEDRLSSSGSETSLPKVSNNYGDLKPKSLDFEGQGGLKKKDPKMKMSKFCHECGSKYPVAVAKYCCECGVRRLII